MVIFSLQSDSPVAGPVRLPCRTLLRALAVGASLGVLGGCSNGFDWDLRTPGVALDTSDAARAASADRPSADARGVISYPTYQVAVAQRGDTVASLAARVGLSGDEVARYNGLAPDMPLRGGEVLALPRRVSEPATASPAAGGEVDITALASGAIERAGATTTAPQAAVPAAPEPVRHQVRRGETAYSIARLYSVSAKALADWNGLGPDLAVREGQFLLIPLPGEVTSGTEAVAAPGQGSVTPVPPSASEPLPDEVPQKAETETGSDAAAAEPPVADLSGNQTAASATRFAFPADGKVIRAYSKGKNDGIDIGAAAGSAVRAAADGTVATITEDTDQVQILVLRHPGNLLTVYANIDGIKVAKGASVSRGQTIASVRSGSPSFMHFEVRQGFESVDPVPFLQ